MVPINELEIRSLLKDGTSALDRPEGVDWNIIANVTESLYCCQESAEIDAFLIRVLKQPTPEGALPENLPTDELSGQDYWTSMHASMSSLARHATPEALDARLAFNIETIMRLVRA